MFLVDRGSRFNCLTPKVVMKIGEEGSFYLETQMWWRSPDLQLCSLTLPINAFRRKTSLKGPLAACRYILAGGKKGGLRWGICWEKPSDFDAIFNVYSWQQELTV